jgi:hypothetical protein
MGREKFIEQRLGAPGIALTPSPMIEMDRRFFFPSLFVTQVPGQIYRLACLSLLFAFFSRPKLLLP